MISGQMVIREMPLCVGIKCLAFYPPLRSANPSLNKLFCKIPARVAGSNTFSPHILQCIIGIFHSRKQGIICIVFWRGLVLPSLIDAFAVNTSPWEIAGKILYPYHL